MYQGQLDSACHLSFVHIHYTNCKVSSTAVAAEMATCQDHRRLPRAAFIIRFASIIRLCTQADNQMGDLESKACMARSSRAQVLPTCWYGCWPHQNWTRRGALVSTQARFSPDFSNFLVAVGWKQTNKTRLQCGV